MQDHTLWHGKYGLCDFYDVCQLPVDQGNMMLDTPLFEPVTWDPLDPRDPDGAKGIKDNIVKHHSSGPTQPEGKLGATEIPTFDLSVFDEK